MCFLEEGKGSGLFDCDIKAIKETCPVFLLLKRVSDRAPRDVIDSTTTLMLIATVVKSYTLLRN